MKGDIKEIVATFTPETPIEELFLYCESVDDFDALVNEYFKSHGLEEVEHFSRLILEVYNRKNAETRLMRKVKEDYQNKSDKYFS